MIGGIAILIWNYRKQFTQSYLLILVWTGVILLSTILHQEYEYYLAVLICILSALAFCYVLEVAEKHNVNLFKGGAPKTVEEKVTEGNPDARKKKQKKGQEKKKKDRLSKKPWNPFTALVAITFILFIVFIGLSLYSDYKTAVITDSAIQ